MFAGNEQCDAIRGIMVLVLDCVVIGDCCNCGGGRIDGVWQLLCLILQLVLRQRILRLSFC
jgi:hypothetical protein